MIPVIFQGMQSIAQGSPELEAKLGLTIVPLPIARTQSGMMSCWKPTPEELAALNNGGAVALTVCLDYQPAVMMECIMLNPVVTQ